MRKNQTINVYPAGWQQNAFCYENDKIWFFCNEVNLLCETDLSEQSTKVLARIEYEGDEKINLYSQIYKLADLLILIPYNAKTLIIFNLQTQEKKRIDGIERIRCSCLKDGKLFMIPQFCNQPIMIFDVEKKCISSQIAFEKESRELIVGLHIVEQEEKIYIPVYGGKKNEISFYYIFNINNNKISKRTIRKKMFGMDSIAILDNKVIFTDAYDNRIYVAEIDSGEIEEEYPGFGDGTMIIGYDENKIYFDSYNSHKLYKFEKGSLLTEYLEKESFGASKINAYCWFKEWFVVFARDISTIYRLENKGGNITKVTTTVDNYQESLCGKLIRESTTFDLKYFICNI